MGINILKSKGKLINIPRHVVGLFFVAIALLLSVLINPAAQASPVSGFNPGKIIDDSIFVRYDSMSVSQIQQFLNSKNPHCDTMGTQRSEYGGGTRAQYAASKGWHKPPYTCLKDYREHGKSAAQIIHDISHSYKINPQVLIVLLQKEQGLVTDTWPLDIQYKTATGYGCPDTAPCDEQYYGLTNQLDWAAKMFRSIMNNSPTWYTPYVLGNNYIQYSPDKSCGGSIVNIQNRSTQALYNYTPYQPNQATLNAGWGTAHCGAYGNRNFYAYFKEWFGSPIKTALPACTAKGLKCVYSFINEDNGKSFYTNDENERDAVYRGNYTYTGIAFHSRVSSKNAQPVYRMYHNKQDFHLWTTNPTEKTVLVNTGDWNDEGVVFYVDSVEANSGVNVRRLYTTHNGGRHVFSTSSSEISDLLRRGFSDEGIAFKAPDTLNTPPIPSTGKVNVYRFFFGDRHFWTTDLNERNILIKGKNSYESVAWETPINGDTPVYRVYSKTGYHFWTTNKHEKSTLVRGGWRDEGISWMAASTGTPTYRFYNTHTGKHLFTTSNPEAEALKKNRVWRYEGVAWYQ